MKATEPIPLTQSHRISELSTGVRFLRAGLVAAAVLMGAQARALTIVPTFDSTITMDANAADIENTINQAIATYEALFSNPITISITFEGMGSGLGQSSKSIYQANYSDFITLLQAGATSSDDATALAHLTSPTTNPVTGTDFIYLSGANALALGFTGPGLDSGNTISLNLSLLNYTRSSIDLGKYDLRAVVQHEIDEILGLGSLVGNPYMIADPLPEDLFRYDDSGNRSFTTSGDNAYFSIDGTTLLARFNQNFGDDSGGDYGDWHSGGTPQVQDAFGTPGSTPNLGIAEITALDVIGYTLVPEPADTVALFGVAALGAMLLRRPVRNRRGSA